MKGIVVVLLALGLMLAGCPAPVDEECPTERDYVCGKDGNTYTNECFAREAGTEVAYKGQCVPANVTECADSDFGKNVLEAGVTTINGEVYVDACVGTSQVTEYYCSDGEVASERIACPEGTECREGKCVALECVDSDEGRDTSVKGTTSKGAESYTDYCEDGTTVKEYYCSDSQILSMLISCASDEGCEDGVCIPVVCSDTDGGLVSTVKGTVRADGTVYIDYCTGGSTLREYYCLGGEVKYGSVDCGSGYYCSNGACKEEECIETDDGIDGDEYGTVRKGSDEYEDYCYDSDTVMEYYCDDGDVESIRVDCDEDEVCDDGECVEERYCTDTDGGINGDERGTAEDADETRTDYCINSRTVEEYYCDGNEVEDIEIECGDEYSCDDGECVETCSDTDGGKNRYTKGTITSGGDSGTDYCVGTNIVMEYYCKDGEAALEAMQCDEEGAYECDGGRCVPACSDSDGGIEVETAGEASFGEDAYPDECTGSHNIKEYYCAHDGVRYKILECPLGKHWCYDFGEGAYCSILIVT